MAIENLPRIWANYSNSLTCIDDLLRCIEDFPRRIHDFPVKRKEASFGKGCSITIFQGTSPYSFEDMMGWTHVGKCVADLSMY